MKTLNLGNIEIWSRDYVQSLDLKSTKEFITYLGNGWRLPHPKEFKIFRGLLALDVGDFAGSVLSSGLYWSSDESWENEKQLHVCSSCYDFKRDGFFRKRVTKNIIRPVRYINYTNENIQNIKFRDVAVRSHS